MSTYIETRAERQVDGCWIELDGLTPFSIKDYCVFGWLGGVRHEYPRALPPIAAKRGLPKDVSESVAYQYENESGICGSWISVSELVAIDYEQAVDLTEVKRHQEYPDRTPGTLREFLGPEFFVDLKHLQDAQADRVIFWFDC